MLDDVFAHYTGRSLLRNFPYYTNRGFSNEAFVLLYIPRQKNLFYGKTNY